MKRKILLFGLMAIAMLFAFQSCKKDEFSDMASLEDARDGPTTDRSTYDRFGINLEKAVDLALNNGIFKISLIQMTLQKPLGDYEVLMTSFLDHQPERGPNIKSILLENAAGLFTEEELNLFLRDYPSLIIATRGNLISTVKGDHKPPTVFIPSSFDERDLEINGTKNRETVNIPLNHHFEHAVVAMHISERHDENGEPLVSMNMTKGESFQNDQPSFSLSNETRGGLPSCDPEPTSCTNPIISSFDVGIVNGGIRLRYEISNFPPSLCYWGRVRINRIGPDQDGNGTPDIHTFNRFAHQYPAFYDVTALPNTEYTYEISARNVYMDETDWVVCHSDETFEETITSPDILPRLNSFMGANKSSSTLKYNWYPPSGLPVTQYRLRRATGNGYSQIPGSPIPAGSNNYAFYNYPTSERGNLLETQIQYKTSSGIWSGDYFDRSYASYRDPNQPLHWYGVHMPNLSDYELSGPNGESNLYGAPEIRLFAIRGAGSLEDRQTVAVQHKIIFTTAQCSETRRIWIQAHPWFPNGFWYEYEVPGEYYVDVSLNPVDILTAWDNYLIGTAVKIVVTETDATEVIIDDWSTETTKELQLSADVGYKALFDVDSSRVEIDTSGMDSVVYDSITIATSIGIESSWASANKITYKYPSTDVDIDIVTIRYHHPFMVVSNKNLYGYNHAGIGEAGKVACELLEYYLE